MTRASLIFLTHFAHSSRRRHCASGAFLFLFPHSIRNAVVVSMSIISSWVLSTQNIYSRLCRVLDFFPSSFTRLLCLTFRSVCECVCRNQPHTCSFSLLRIGEYFMLAATAAAVHFGLPIQCIHTKSRCIQFAGASVRKCNKYLK